MEEKNIKNKQGGITLITLVVTIVVLLILAGVSINLVLGNNGIITQAYNAKIKNILAEFVERANMEWSAEDIQEKTGGEKVSLDRIVTALREQGYNIETLDIGEDAITGIKLLDGENEIESLSLAPNQEKELKICLEKNTENYSYYVVVNQRYFLISLTESGITVSSQSLDINNRLDIEILPATEHITIQVNFNGEFITISDKIKIAENSKIKIIANESLGETDFEISYSNIKKNIRVDIGLNQYTGLIVNQNTEGVEYYRDSQRIYDLTTVGTPQQGDNVIYKDYSYTFVTSQSWGTWIKGNVTDCWNVKYIGNSQTPGELCGELFGKYVKSMNRCFSNKNITLAPCIPNSIEDMSSCFYQCKNLIKAPYIPDSVLCLQMTFYYCEKLNNVRQN